MHAAAPSGNARAELNRFTSVAFRTLLFVAVFGFSLAMACARLAEAPGSPLAWSRTAATLAAIAVVAFARRRTIVRRAVLAFALESATGIATLAYVDIPYVLRHQVQIASSVAASYRGATQRDIVADIRGLDARR